MMRTAGLPLALVVALLAWAVPAPVAAHGPGTVTPETLWSTWHLDAWLLVGLVLAGALYARGARRVWSTRSAWQVLPVWRAAACTAGLLALAVALVSPLEPLSSTLLSAHMAQHVLLMTIAAPLLVLGSSRAVLASALPPPAVRSAHRWWRGRPLLRAAWRVAGRPTPAWLLYVGVLFAWHHPALYQAALRSDAVHAVEHAMLLAVALLFWRVVSSAGRRDGVTHPAAAFMLFTALLAHSAFSALVTFSDLAWYPHYEATAPAWGLTAIEDQQLGGAIMWTAGKLAHLVAALLVLRAWFARMGLRDATAPGAGTTAHLDLLATRRMPR